MDPPGILAPGVHSFSERENGVKVLTKILEICWNFIRDHFEWFIAIEGAILTTAVLKRVGTIPAAMVFAIHLLMVMLFFAFAGEGADGAGTMVRTPNPGSLIPVVVKSTSASSMRGNSRKSSAIWF